MAKVQGPGILNQWSCHIPGCANQKEKFFQLVLVEMQNKKADLKPYWDKVGSTFGAKKQFLAIDQGQYTCYIGAETLGTDLYVNWLIYDPRWAKEQAARQRPTAAILWGLFGSDIGGLNEMSCFAAVIKDCAVMAAEKLYEEANLDKGRINRASSGALGPI